MTKPKIFGHLYVAVFSNGTVKAGMSAKDPQSRITSHAHAGKAFGISMDSSFLASIYTNDVRAREKLMHEEMLQRATKTAGREWFKFANFENALNFAATYLHKVERMSFAERPSQEEIDRAAAKKSAASDGWIKLFSSISLETKEQKTQREIADAEAFLDTLKPVIVLSLATNVMFLDDYYFMCEEEKTPVLSKVIGEHYDAFYDTHGRDIHKAVWSDEARKAASESPFCINHTLDLKSARKIISAAMLHDEFFHEACSMKHQERQEVAA